MPPIPAVFVTAEGYPTYIATSNTYPRNNRGLINVTTDRYKRPPITFYIPGALL